MHHASRCTTLALALAAAALSARAASAQQITPPPAKATTHATTHHAPSQAALRAEAKVSEDSARAVALAQVPNGTVKSSELEREKGKLIYSFDVTVPGKSGVEEVNVDALTGALVAHQHETAKAERTEAKQEAAETAPARSGAKSATTHAAPPAKPGH